MTDNIRTALEMWPFHRELRRGIMDLKPSLAIHLAKTLDLTPSNSDTDLVELVNSILALVEQWENVPAIPGNVAAEQLRSLIFDDEDEQ